MQYSLTVNFRGVGRAPFALRAHTGTAVRSARRASRAEVAVTAQPAILPCPSLRNSAGGRHHYSPFQKYWRQLAELRAGTLNTSCAGSDCCWQGESKIPRCGMSHGWPWGRLAWPREKDNDPPSFKVETQCKSDRTDNSPPGYLGTPAPGGHCPGAQESPHCLFCGLGMQPDPVPPAPWEVNW